MNLMVVKRKLGKRLRQYICNAEEHPGLPGPTPWHGAGHIGHRLFPEDAPYLYDTQLPDVPYAGPSFTWRLWFPDGAWHFPFTVVDGQGEVLLHAIEFIRPLTQEGNVLTYEDMELDLYHTPDGEVIVVDEDEMEDAVKRELMTREESHHLYEECRAIRDAIAAGTYPWP